MVRDGYNYRSRCKRCGAIPFSEGPHHSAACVRHQPMQAIESELVLSNECRYCGVRPFIAGPHHAPDCRRFFELEPTGIRSPDAGEAVEPVPPGRQMTLEHVLDIFEASDVPLLTVEEVAETLDCSPEAARGGLEWLVERGALYKKSVGRDAEVFLLVEEPLDSP